MTLEATTTLPPQVSMSRLSFSEACVLELNSAAQQVVRY
jgi:hypothetical protein